MHSAAFNYVRSVVARGLPEGGVIEIGSRDVNGSVRPLFAGRPYTGIDLAPGPGVDVISPGHVYTPLMTPSVVVCTEVLEHTATGAELCAHVYDYLADGGVFIVTAAGPDRAAHSAIDGLALRADEYYGNVYPDTLRAWLRPFQDVQIIVNSETHDIYATAWKGERVVHDFQWRKRVLLVHPGASFATADVYDGLHYGLTKHGIRTYEYRLDVKFKRAKNWLNYNARQARKVNPEIPKPTNADILYQAGIGILERALRYQVDTVIVVSALLLHPDVVVLLKRAGVHVTVLFTETPYDMDRELKLASLVDGCWTNERVTLADFQRVNPRVGYLPHAWHPERHRVDVALPADTPAYDVVFVGSGFPERIAWLNAIDWRGINLGLFGTWDKRELKPEVAASIRAKQITNQYAAELYRRCKVGINLYRNSTGFGPFSSPIVRAESLNPRAYELAALGVFHVSDHRDEVTEIFGDLVPTFRTAEEATALLRRWLADDAGRARIASQLPARVAESSWVERAALVIGDVQTLLASAA